MSSSLLLSVALLFPAAPVPKDAAPPATSPAPRVVTAYANSEGKIRLLGQIRLKRIRVVEEIVIENGKEVVKRSEKEVIESEERGRPLAEVKATFSTAGGKELTVDEAIARVKDGTTLLVSADGKPVAKAWLRAVRDDTVVMVAEGLWHFQPYWGDPPRCSTPAPRLTMLGTDERGRVVAPVTTHPLNWDGKAYDDDSIFHGVLDGPAWRNRAVVDYTRVPPPPKPGVAKVVQKPLADISFTAFDLKGKPVTKEDALKQLAAGGLVIVASTSRMPDEKYLKGFRDDILILLTPELLLPVEPLDQTGRKPVNDPKK